MGNRLANSDGRSNDKVNLICCDPLAEYYAELFIKHGIEQVVPCIKCDGEHLLEKFPYNRFDVVTARNCLDHSYSPEQAILQMGAISKKYVYLRHCIDEGKNAAYQGLHQWNFKFENDHFLIENRDGTQVDFTSKYDHLFNFQYRLFEEYWKDMDRNQVFLEVILEKK